jgi:CheY-like chemotaxis protein
VLVVDDSEDVRHLWRAALTLSGFAVTEAVNGKDAVGKAVAGAPDVILMDFCMPGMNGAEAVDALKRDARTAATPVIGVTAHATSPATQEFRRLCDAVLEKPVSPQTLVEALRLALGAQRPETAIEPIPT